ncbi:DUF3761 domain-containing protein [Oxalobacter sp. OttesenSCG-928-P03]|nr:DUF3761 domain-containing protein [Oxalobacter sp. OttesenSCG-928-P03]
MKRILPIILAAFLAVPAIAQDKPQEKPAPAKTEKQQEKNTEKAESRPDGATARCNDGTYTHSPKGTRGACLGHKGVAEWF